MAEHLEKKNGDVLGALTTWRLADELGGGEGAKAEIRRLTAKVDRWDGLLELLAKELAKAGDDSAKVDVWRRTAQVYRVGVVFVGEATPADDTRTVPGPMRAFLDRLADHGCGRTR